MCCLRRQRPYVTAIDESDQKMAQSPINKINNVMRLPVPGDHPFPRKTFKVACTSINDKPLMPCFAQNDYDWPRSRRFASDHYAACTAEQKSLFDYLRSHACAPSVTLSISFVPLTPLTCVCTLMLHTFALRE